MKMYDRINKWVTESNSGIFIKNAEKNVRIKGYSGIKKLINELNNRKFIVICEGPSLDDKLNMLSKITNKSGYITLVMDKALKRVLDAGCRVDYCFTCEARRKNYFKGIDTKNIGLISFIGSNNGNILDWQGKIYFYNWKINSSVYNDIDRITGNRIGHLKTCSLISTNAYSFAIECKAKEIILFGQDLAFANEKVYCKGTVIEHHWLVRNSRINPFINENWNFILNNSNYVISRNNSSFARSNYEMIAAKLWIEDDVKHKNHNIKIKDFSPFGIYGKSIEKGRAII